MSIELAGTYLRKFPKTNEHAAFLLETLCRLSTNNMHKIQIST